MAFGPLARIAAQVVMVAGGAVARAVAQAYREAAKNPEGNAAMAQLIRRRMKIDEATKILDVDASKFVAAGGPRGTMPPAEEVQVFVEKVKERAAVMIELNAIDAKGVGSP